VSIFIVNNLYVEISAPSCFCCLCYADDLVVMGHCQSSCCPLHSRTPKTRNGHPMTRLSADASLLGNKRPESTGGGVGSAIVARCHMDLHEHADPASNCSDLRQSGGHSCHVSESKIYVELTRPHSDRHPTEKKRTLQATSSSTSDSALEAHAHVLFECYCDLTEEDCISVSGIERLCTDLGLEPEDFLVLLLAWKCSAATMCCLTRSEFVSGCRILKATTTDAILSRLKDLTVDVQQDQDMFRDLYRWAYGFALDTTVLQRSLPLDIAIAMWRLVFSGADAVPKILPRWFEFLEKRDDVQFISRDTWEMFLVFITKIGDDLDSYDETEAWPSLLDDFVEYENDRQNQNLFLDLQDKVII